MEDLKIIKKLYGEAMMHFCREYFSTILEEQGKLPEIFQNTFAPSHILYDDLSNQSKIPDFKNYIYDIFHNDKKEKVHFDVRSPQELMSLAGYTLYECKTESDIQAFEKYYAKGEELCTFNGGRLNSCYVFFAVKENVDEIKREDFKNPERQDLYGTSVISIQFLRDSSHTLSIKNRYNYRVANPDATFGNNLDNIIEGLTESFEQTYELKQEHRNEGFEIPGYVRANDGRWYKFNYEINNVYYCPNNIIIDNYVVKQFPKEKYLIMDYFIFDLVEKKIYLYDDTIFESLPTTIGEIKKITVVKKCDEKEITIINDKDEEIIIIINKNNQIIGLKSNDIKIVGHFFLENNKTIENLEMPNMQQVGDNFLCGNIGLTTLEMPMLKLAGSNFLLSNRLLSSVHFPLLQQVGNRFMNLNGQLLNLELPLLEKAGSWFLSNNKVLKEIELPNLQRIYFGFLNSNVSLTSFDLSELQEADTSILRNNSQVREEILSMIETKRGFKI